MTKRTDPVAKMGRELAALHRRAALLDQINITYPGHKERLAIEREYYATADRIAAIEDMIGCTKAESIGGALCQLSVLATDAADIFTLVLDESDREKLRRRIQRMIYSICCAVEDATGVSHFDFAGDAYLGPSADPWATAGDLGEPAVDSA